MDRKLCVQALTKFFGGLFLIAALLFLSAGTFAYAQGRLFLAVQFIPMFLAGLVMMKKAPDFLRKRLSARESEAAQKWVIALSGLMFIGVYVAAGLSFRFSFWLFPKWVVCTGTVLYLAAYALVAEAMRENAFLSRTIEVQAHQTVVDTGLYGIVRHPMYAATLLLFLMMPCVLGSGLALLIMLIYPVLLVIRIKNEEKVLEEGLVGYKEYEKRVKYRILPFIW